MKKNGNKSIRSCGESERLIGFTLCLTADRDWEKIKKKSSVTSGVLEAFHLPLPRSPVSIHLSTCPGIRPHKCKETPFPGNLGVGATMAVESSKVGRGEGKDTSVCQT